MQVNPAPASRFLSVVRQSAAPLIDVFINLAAKAKGNKKRGADVCSCTPDYGVEWMTGEPAERPSTVGVSRQGYAGVSAGPELWRAAGEGGVESYDLKGAFPLKCLPG